jgi:hypothetical protein
MLEAFTVPETKEVKRALIRDEVMDAFLHPK